MVYTTAIAIPDTNARIDALLKATEALTAAQRWEEAQCTAKAIPEAMTQTQVLKNLTVSLCQANRWTEAHCTAIAIPNTHVRAVALGSLAHDLALSGCHTDAEKILAETRVIINKLYKAELYDQAIYTFMEALMQVQYWSEACAAANIISKQAHPQTLTRLVEVLVYSQQWDKARATADAIMDEDWSNRAHNLLVIALSRAHCWDEARAAAEATPGAYQRAKLLSRLANTLAHAQLPDEAEITFLAAHRAARAVPQECGHVDALQIVAAALLQANRVTEAQSIFDEAYATATAIVDSWVRETALRSFKPEYWDHCQHEALPLTGMHPVAQEDTEIRSSLTKSLSRAQKPSDVATIIADALAIASAIQYTESRTEALRELVITLARTKFLSQATALLTDLWYRAQTFDELLGLFVVPPELLRAYPELGQAFLDSFAWVDAQLKAS
ncbi:MAG: hypothetical protein HGA19_00365 [Oscillochloris sp.]|nr:hypothetical protein [Oscillochloris sp.]